MGYGTAWVAHHEKMVCPLLSLISPFSSLHCCHNLTVDIATHSGVHLYLMTLPSPFNLWDRPYNSEWRARKNNLTNAASSYQAWLESSHLEAKWYGIEAGASPTVEEAKYIYCKMLQVKQNFVKSAGPKLDKVIKHAQIHTNAHTHTLTNTHTHTHTPKITLKLTLILTGASSHTHMHTSIHYTQKHSLTHSLSQTRKQTQTQTQTLTLTPTLTSTETQRRHSQRQIHRHTCTLLRAQWHLVFSFDKRSAASAARPRYYAVFERNYLFVQI